MNNKGGFGGVLIALLMLVMTLLILVALLPLFTSVVNTARQSDHLNCAGYVYGGNSTNLLSYNSSLSTDSISCTAFDLTVPFIVLCVIIGGVAMLLSTRGENTGVVDEGY